MSTSFSHPHIPPSASHSRFTPESAARSVHARFEQIVGSRPEAPAVCDAQRTWTYGELDRLATGIAEKARSVGASKGTVVGTLLPASVLTPAAILGLSRFGTLQVPLGPTTLPAHLEEILLESGAQIVLTDPGNAALARSTAGKATVVIVSEDLEGTDPPSASVGPDDPFYIIYSSGSTGRPKGILHPHRTRMHHVAAYVNAFGIGPDDRHSLLHLPGFNASQLDCLVTLLSGACLCIYDLQSRGFEPLADWLETMRITVLHWLPSPFRRFAGTLPPDRRFEHLRLAVIGSEPVLPGDVELFHRHFPPPSQFVNRLGTSESGIFTVFPVLRTPSFDDSVVPVGYPVEGYEVEVWDETGQAVPRGAAGEVVIRSAYLSPGYWRRPELTAQAYPDVPAGETRIYRTRDLGRQRPDGCLEILGRGDSLVKIRGQFVALVEVEAALVGLPEIGDAAVRTWPDATGEEQLVAYLLAAPNSSATTSSLRTALAEVLPPAAIPARFVWVDELPATRTGKIDRRRLPPPNTCRPRLDAEYVAPMGPIEEELARFWTEVLEVTLIGRNDSFLDLGGNSLRAVQLASRINESWGVRVDLTCFFAAPTLAATAETLLLALSEGAPSGGFDPLLVDGVPAGAGIQ